MGYNRDGGDIMKRLRKIVPNKYISIAVGGVLALLGLFFIIRPDTSLFTLCSISGAIVLIAGIIKLVNYLNYKKQNAESPFDMITAVALLICALILLIHPKFLLSILPFFIGIVIAFYGASSLLSSRRRSGLLGKIISTAVIIYGLSLIFNPFKGATALASAAGFGLLVWGIVKIVSELLVKRPPLIPDDTDGDGYKEVEFKDI